MKNEDLPSGGEKKLHVPQTEGIKYAGSKLKIIPQILDIVEGLPVKTILDGFSGSTRVSQAFAKNDFVTTSNDVSVWSETFAKAYLLNKEEPKYYQSLIDHLNGLNGYEGWFSEHYGAAENNGKKYPFQLKNTKKLDAIRDEIDRLNLPEVEKAIALASLILALDSVDSTLGHYAAYLSEWSSRSHKDLVLKVPKLFINEQENRVMRGDIFETIKKEKFDLAYFDPPYGSNNEKMPPSRVRYNSYYHIWTSVILNDKPLLFGKAARREDSRDEVAASVFEEFRKDENGHFIAMQAVRKLVNETKANYVLLSYSSGGRTTKEELYDILNTGGKLIKAKEIDYKKNVMANMRWTHEWVNSDGRHVEYLFLMQKQ
ncbi:DNA methyltransferase [Flavisolibacter ginsenosidimutans]|uniref:site-specific DNA-methyltransferase (adenine-specific) n=2 Tax=Flavisolibacter ginsenosidimutans TaxID=661481 RepID=A0A5B8UR47_9BACT|nr:DNA methyltransferase [Flavisolibacter ginsenosidimutans]